MSRVDEHNELTEQQTATVIIPPGILATIPKEEDVSIAVVVFDDTTFFPSDQVLTETIVGSQVISIQVAGVEDGTQLDAPIQLKFFLTQVMDRNETNIENPVCVFWDFALASK